MISTDLRGVERMSGLPVFLGLGLRNQLVVGFDVLSAPVAIGGTHIAELI